MIIRWDELILRIIIWLVLEIVLNLLGFDDLADYTEFIIENKKTYVRQVYKKKSDPGMQKPFKKKIFFTTDRITL